MEELLPQEDLGERTPLDLALELEKCETVYEYFEPSPEVREQICDEMLLPFYSSRSLYSQKMEVLRRQGMSVEQREAEAEQILKLERDSRRRELETKRMERVLRAERARVAREERVASQAAARAARGMVSNNRQFLADNTEVLEAIQKRFKRQKKKSRRGVGYLRRGGGRGGGPSRSAGAGR